MTTMVQEKERVQVESRAELRAWLAKNYQQANGVWLITFKKHMADKHVPYDDVVEEVLCFGWIDSLPRKLDGERSMLYISPRRKKSPWSRLNKTRITKLLAANLITPAGMALIEQAKADGSWTVYDEIEALIIPPDLTAALAENRTAERHFMAFSDSAKKGILWWIKRAKREPTRQKRIAETVALAAENLRANFPQDKQKK